MEPFKQLQSQAMVLAVDNINTDQIIPARYLKGTEKHGLGSYLFHDWRYDASGRLREDFGLNQVASTNAQILVVGENFGCGSSREHAPWALMDFGFKAIIGRSFADIFQSNAIKNGLVCIKVEPDFHEILTAEAFQPVHIDLERQRITTAAGIGQTFFMEPFARYCLLNGLDQMDILLSHEQAIRIYEMRVL